MCSLDGWVVYTPHTELIDPKHAQVCVDVAHTDSSIFPCPPLPSCKLKLVMK